MDVGTEYKADTSLPSTFNISVSDGSLFTDRKRETASSCFVNGRGSSSPRLLIMKKIGFNQRQTSTSPINFLPFLIHFDRLHFVD